jgi:hypothetical protein
MGVVQGEPSDQRLRAWRKPKSMKVSNIKPDHQDSTKISDALMTRSSK